MRAAGGAREALVSIGSRRSARALQGGSLRRSGEEAGDCVPGKSGHLGGAGQPARKVGFETERVGGAGGLRLARGLVHDAVVEKVRGRAGQDALGASLPLGLGGAVGDVVHDGGAVHPNAGVVGPLRLVDGRALFAGAETGTVKNIVVLVDETNLLHPVKDFASPVGIGLVAGVASEAGANVEETAVTNGVLVSVPVVEGEDLPPQAATTVFFVPASDVFVKDSLGKGEPLHAAI